MHYLLLFAMLNKWVYTHDESLLPEIATEVYHDERVGMVVLRDETCVVVHRGTWSAEDLYYDLKSELYQKCNNIGFLEPFFESYEHDHNIDMLVQEQGCVSVYYTGHSLGGVTARMASELAYHKVPIKGLVTFGEPKACCGININTVNSTRIINGQDPIPSLPTGKVPQHCSSKVLNLVEKTWLDDLDYPYDVPSHPLYRLVHNHRMSSYVNSVEKYIQNLPNRLDQIRIDNGMNIYPRKQIYNQKIIK